MNDKLKLGLPLEYQKMPECFDAHNINVDTGSKNALIERLLKEQNEGVMMIMRFVNCFKLVLGSRTALQIPFLLIIIN